MIVPEQYKGQYDGAFFKKEGGMCCFICYGQSGPDEGKKLLENLGYRFLEEARGVNIPFISAANAYAADYSRKNEFLRCPNLEEIIEFAQKHPNL